MKTLKTLKTLLILAATLSSALAPAATRLVSDETSYERAHDALDERDWEEAVELFRELAGGRGRRADASLYWMAYAQSKARRLTDALATLDELDRRFPDSNWGDEAASLRLELRERRGERRSDAGLSCETKVQALQYLMQDQPERAEERLLRFLDGDCDDETKRLAVFVLAQSGTRSALRILGRQAREGRDAALRRQAIETLGVFGGNGAAPILEEVYRSSRDVEARTAVLESFMVAGLDERLLSVARDETDPTLKRVAIQQLGVMGKAVALEALYDSRDHRSVREEILAALMIAGETEALHRRAREERDPELRMHAINLLGAAGAVDELQQLYEQERSSEIREALLESFMVAGLAEPIMVAASDRRTPADLRLHAIQLLGVMGEGDDLLHIYESSPEIEVREAVVQAMFLTGQVDAMVRIASTEKETPVRLAAIRALGLVGDDDAFEALLGFYDEHRDEETRGAVLDALFVGGDPKHLIRLARKEKDPRMRARIVQQLAAMNSSEARELMLEILEEK